LQRFSKAVAVSAIALGLGFSSSAYSQGRTIEETLVVSDPTVAAAGKWKVGGALEYWLTHTEYDIVDTSGNKVGDSSLNLNQTGFNVFGAYSNWTLQATQRSGKGDYTASEGGFTYSGPQKQTDQELTLRYLFPARTVSPYVLVGYGKTEVKQDFTLTAPPGSTWSCTGNASVTQTTEYKGPLLGGGAIVPFSEKLGMRADLRLHWYKGSNHYSGTGCASSESSGLGYDMTVTGYWNIIAGLNAQIGGKATWLNGGSDVPQWFKWGLFGMLGYTIQF
jgi:hypothetical protein